MRNERGVDLEAATLGGAAHARLEFAARHRGRKHDRSSHKRAEHRIFESNPEEVCSDRGHNAGAVRRALRIRKQVAKKLCALDVVLADGVELLQLVDDDQQLLRLGEWLGVLRVDRRHSRKRESFSQSVDGVRTGPHSGDEPALVAHPWHDSGAYDARLPRARRPDNDNEVFGCQSLLDRGNQVVTAEKVLGVAFVERTKTFVGILVRPLHG